MGSEDTKLKLYDTNLSNHTTLRGCEHPRKYDIALRHKLELLGIQ